MKRFVGVVSIKPNKPPKVEAIQPSPFASKLSIKITDTRGPTLDDRKSVPQGKINDRVIASKYGFDGAWSCRLFFVQLIICSSAEIWNRKELSFFFIQTQPESALYKEGRWAKPLTSAPVAETSFEQQLMMMLKRCESLNSPGGWVWLDAPPLRDAADKAVE